MTVADAAPTKGHVTIAPDETHKLDFTFNADTDRTFIPVEK
jgi:hypothetical protein